MKDFIELNGKHYDARTGKVLPDPLRTRTAPTSTRQTPKQGRAVDSIKQPRAPQPSPTTGVRHKTERSKTLMRQAVKKPLPAKTPATPAPAVRRHPAPRLDVDPTRVSRAQKIHKSHLVSRFGQPAPLKAQTSALPVRPAPELRAAPILAEHHVSPLDAKLGQTPFQAALDKATSHTQPRIKKTTKRQHLSRRLRVSSKIINITAASLAALLIAGFIAYQNAPNLSMRLAAARAGMHGVLPDYQPAGFGLAGPIEYKRGQITLHYKSHSDERQFQVNQRISGWNSATLLENFVAADRHAYQTYEDNGKTIYIYGGDNATWVDGGVWYRIEGKSSLNNDQLLRLASSM